VAFSHDSKKLASASEDKIAKVWDASSGQCLQTFEGHVDRVLLIAFSHDSVRLASGSGDATVKIWDASNGKCFQTLKLHSDEDEDEVWSVVFSHDSAWLASASHRKFRIEQEPIEPAPRDCTVKIWDANSGECLQTLMGHSDFVHSVAFLPHSSRLASASSDGTVRIWDASSGECLQTLKIGNPASNILFDSTGSYLYPC